MKSDAPAGDVSPPFRIAAIATAYYPCSHADVLLSRWLEPRPADADWGWPGSRTQLASLYVEQMWDRDMAAATARRHALPLCDSIHEALTLGGKTLAVDAVMLIGEHGEYALNEFGQKLYPRKAMFDEIVAVFNACGRHVPVFCDKHLGWDFADALEMVETARRQGFLLLAGSSLPHARSRPPLPTLDDARMREAVGIFFGASPHANEAHGIHSVEVVQALVERRTGGERGVRSVTAYTGDEVWRQQERGRWSAELVAAAVQANDHVEPGAIHTNCSAAGAELTAWVVEHHDGFQATYLNLEGHVSGWSAAFQTDDGIIHAMAPVIGSRDDHFAHFATFARIIEDAFLTGRCCYPLERVLLATGIIQVMMQARQRPGVPQPTPHLNLPYRMPSAAARKVEGT